MGIGYFIFVGNQDTTENQNQNPMALAYISFI